MFRLTFTMPCQGSNGAGETEDAVRDVYRDCGVMARLVIIVALAFCLSAGSASADRGVALDLGRLDVEQTLTPGGGYSLPPIGVRNPGDEVTSYKIVVSHVQGQTASPFRRDGSALSRAMSR